MSETFIELVPRCAPSLRQSMTELEGSDVPFDGYNIPELLRNGQSFLQPEDVLRLRSERAISRHKQLAVHLRTRERSVRETIDRVSLAAHNGADLALLITGDRLPAHENRCTHAHEVLAAQRNKYPMRIGVAADVYQPDWGRWNKKVPAIGKTVDAVFTQPLFGTSLLEEIHRRTHDLLPPDKIYVGITWITTERHRRYWHEQNGVPLDCLPHGNSHAEIAQNSMAQAADVLRAIRQQGYSTYIMLMRNTVAELQRVFSLAENMRET